MNILYIDHYAGSPKMGMEFRPYYLSREWVKAGHHVRIFAADYSHLRIYNPSVSTDFTVEIIDGIEYCWLKTATYEGNGARRALTMGQFVFKLLLNARRIVKEWHPDIVIASSTYPLDTYPAQRIAKISGAKYIHEVHDMWPSTLYEIGGMSKRHPFVVLMQIAEDSAYKHCDKCVSLAPYTKSYMMEHGLEASKFLNIQNGIVLEEWLNPEPLPDEHMAFFKEHANRFIVGYFGGHAMSNALDSLLDTAELLRKRSDIIFVLVGDGVEKNRLISRKEALQLNNVFFLNPVNKRCIPSLTQYFDCSIITGEPSPLYRFGLCVNKMYDSMMAGKPVICANNAPATLVSEFNCGIQVTDVNADNIKSAILQIADMSESDRIAVGEKGRDAVLKFFTYNKLADQFLNGINN